MSTVVSRVESIAMPTLDSVRDACLDDLSRFRQEELPLSSETRSNRPTFAPRSTNAAAQYPIAQKVALGNKWSAPVYDEESRQMEGLANGDARPWARTATVQYMHANHATTAPPATFSIPPLSHVGNTPQYSSRQLSAMQAASVATMQNRVTGSTQAQVPVASPTPGQRPLQSQSAHGGREFNFVRDRDNEEPVGARTAQQAGMNQEVLASYDHELLKGTCTIMINSNTSFMVEFALKASVAANSALLSLFSPSKGHKVHNVLDLEKPVLDRDICVVNSKKEKGAAFYRLQFPNTLDAEKFWLYFDSLQRSAIRHQPPSTLSSPAPDSQQHDKAVRNDNNPLPVALSSIDIEPRVNRVSVMGANAAAGVKVTQAQEPQQLIDIEDSATATASQPQDDVEGTIENAAQHLHELVGRILPAIIGTRGQVSEQAVHEIQDAAISNWLQRGFLASEDDDIKEGLIQLLRSLANLKAKMDRHKHDGKNVTVSKSMSGMAPNVASAGRIQYTPAEMQNLKKASIQDSTSIQGLGSQLKSFCESARGPTEKTTPRHHADSPMVIENDVPLDQQDRLRNMWENSAPGKSAEPAAATSLKYTEWLVGEPEKQLDLPKETIQKRDGGPKGTKGNSVGGNNEQAAIPQEPSFSTMKPSSATLTPTASLSGRPGGLATSRWATPKTAPEEKVFSTLSGQAAPFTPQITLINPAETNSLPNSDSKSAFRGLKTSRWA